MFPGAAARQGKFTLIIPSSTPSLTSHPIQKALRSFFGIGELRCNMLMARFHIHPTATIGELATKQVLDLTGALSNMKIENDLKREILNNIKRLKDTGTYRGRRHALNLPVRGQNTRSQIKSAIEFNRIDRQL
ncbi:putative mitochondrial 37S ribosomal protein SWS2 [Arthroderma uncinatum]|uniref:putative mitochondrial 37S ribosomal protein SWS2 n=1 Tax=Arthroderma uncinatum TaxID=74035 RepID=UPI00144AB043|nr:putative mitochondrial 37S ribosomal protein SWS2 [Arthroderma uncinatum]KAF3481638.1 putative mitochondrial 37S ribosomal protein SWS2 [Arthroderma uncinatum]